MARPVVPDPVEELYRALGPITAGDAEQGWALLKFCHAVAGPVAAVADLAYDTDTKTGWQDLLDVSAAPAMVLPWLGQFAGAVIPDGMPAADARTLIQDAPGWKRGTPAAIVAATRLFLAGG